MTSNQGIKRSRIESPGKLLLNLDDPSMSLKISYTHTKPEKKNRPFADLKLDTQTDGRVFR